MDTKVSPEIAAAESGQRPQVGRISNLFNSIVAIVTVVGVFFSVFIYFYDKKNKDIHLVILDSAAFFQNRADFSQAVSINVGSKRVEQLWYVKLRYENFGKLPIKKDEIESSTKVHFANSEVLSVSTAEKKPENLELEIGSQTNSIQLKHGLLNPGDFIVIDVLVSASKAPVIQCDYRIADIPSCAVRDESSASREFYVVGIKVNDNLALLAVSVAFLASLVACAGLIYVVGDTAKDVSRRLISSYKIDNLEDAISLFKKNFYEEIKDIKLSDNANFKYSYPTPIKNEAISKLLDHPSDNSTVAELLDSARSQQISASTAHAVEKILQDLINSRTSHFLFFSDSVKSPAKLVDFEREAISVLISNRFKADLSGFFVGIPLLILTLDVVFVCVGPLRTLLQKWI